MSLPLIRDCDNYVVLEPGKPERFLSADETLLWLESWLKKLETLPRDLEIKSSIGEVAQHLLDTACDLEIRKGFVLQWFAVRLDHPEL